MWRVSWLGANKEVQAFRERKEVGVSFMEDVVTEKNHKECGGTPWQNSGECFAVQPKKKKRKRKKRRGEFQLIDMDAKEFEVENWHNQRNTGTVRYIVWFPK